MKYLKRILKVLMPGYIVTGILLLVLSGLLYKFELDESKVKLGIIVIYFISCLVSGFIAGKAFKSKKFLWGMVAGALYFVILVLVSLGVNKELEGAIMDIITTLVICIGSGMLGGMIS